MSIISKVASAVVLIIAATLLLWIAASVIEVDVKHHDNPTYSAINFFEVMEELKSSSFNFFKILSKIPYAVIIFRVTLFLQGILYFPWGNIT